MNQFYKNRPNFQYALTGTLLVLSMQCFPSPKNRNTQEPAPHNQERPPSNERNPSPRDNPATEEDLKAINDLVEDARLKIQQLEERRRDTYEVHRTEWMQQCAPKQADAPGRLFDERSVRNHFPASYLIFGSSGSAIDQAKKALEKLQATRKNVTPSSSEYRSLASALEVLSEANVNQLFASDEAGLRQTIQEEIEAQKKRFKLYAELRNEWATYYKSKIVPLNGNAEAPIQQGVAAFIAWIESPRNKAYFPEDDTLDVNPEDLSWKSALLAWDGKSNTLQYNHINQYKKHWTLKQLKKESRAAMKASL